MLTYTYGARNPASVLTVPSGTPTYTANDLVASSATAGSVVVPSIEIMRVNGGSITIPRMKLFSNHTTGLSGVIVAVRLWSAAPTYTNGDDGAYAVATGAANFLVKLTGTFEQFGDGAVAELAPAQGVAAFIKLADGKSVYWDLQATTGFTRQASKTFTLVNEGLPD
jgi:Ca2+-binding RTX toxin-like protein